MEVSEGWSIYDVLMIDLKHTSKTRLNFSQPCKQFTRGQNNIGAPKKRKDFGAIKFII